MPFEKGKSGNPAGRIKGEPTKDTKRFKEALNGLLEHCADDMILWLGEIKDPKQRFDVLKDFAEYIYPKLSRAESKQDIKQELIIRNAVKDLPNSVTDRD